MAIIISALALIGIIGAIALMIQGYAFIDELSHEDDDVNTFLIIIIVIYNAVIIFSIVTLYASTQLLQGTENRNHKQCRLFMVVAGVAVPMSFLQLYPLNLTGMIATSVTTVMSSYFCVCVYSLYVMFKQEALQTPPLDPTP